ncbi:hypothetical protein [Psychrobacter sp. FME5]|uniref:hypothetical protein n=1 Tax=Psychrobacter sp. FME5 TaxID=2487706 RepID=UPI00178818CA|nr:hypothetical protein [Psychrobacter sp. FME5]MBE0445420.1 hypothetical protein [Psychrobacter sp. FME5]
MSQDTNNNSRETSVFDTFSTALEVKALDIDNSWIEEIREWSDTFDMLGYETPNDKEVSRIQKLEVLEIIEVEVTGLDEQEYRRIYRINYSSNELTYLTGHVEINFHGINSSDLTNNMDHLTNLTKLFINRYELRELPQSLGQLSNLTGLFIA